MPSRVIDTTRLDKGEIRSMRGGIKVNGQRVPLEDVGTLLLGGSVTITGGALAMLAKYDVVVLNCDWRGVPDLVGYGWSANSRVAARHRAQADVSLPRRKASWASIVKAKIRGQRRNLEAFGAAGVERLRSLERETRSGDTTNCEAQAAKLSFQGLFGEEGFTRLPGQGGSINALLDYGYTVMRGHVIRAIGAAGLCPTLALWHRNRGNTFVLADDLIEPFRPAVDFTVRSLPVGASLDDREVKEALVGVAGTAMGRAGRPSKLLSLGWRQRWRSTLRIPRSGSWRCRLGCRPPTSDSWRTPCG